MFVRIYVMYACMRVCVCWYGLTLVDVMEWRLFFFFLLCGSHFQAGQCIEIGVGN
jgi:hypothetical protein